MKKMIRRWLNRYKNQRRKKHFENQLDINLDSLIRSCEKVVFNKTGSPVYTKFRDLGGANNEGMLLHYSTQSQQPVAISKIEESALAEREYRFLTWQKNHRSNALAATPIGLFPTTAPRHSCFISSVLEHPKSFSYLKAQQLFEQLGKDTKLLAHLSLTNNAEDLKDELDDSTKIKSILVHLVSQFGTANAERFYKAFLKERVALFDHDQRLIISLQTLMNRIYTVLKSYDMSLYEGLVHGDFKQQNIMECRGSYRVIDCQYYTYGIRVWDLAFLYSKDKRGFTNIKQHIENNSLYEEKLLMIFFYIIASLINVKKKRIRGVIDYQIAPASLYADQLLGCGQ